jgi:hypothetical protein
MNAETIFHRRYRGVVYSILTDPRPLLRYEIGGNVRLTLCSYLPREMLRIGPSWIG